MTDIPKRGGSRPFGSGPFSQLDTKLKSVLDHQWHNFSLLAEKPQIIEMVYIAQQKLQPLQEFLQKAEAQMESILQNRSRVRPLIKRRRVQDITVPEETSLPPNLSELPLKPLTKSSSETSISSRTTIDSSPSRIAVSSIKNNSDIQHTSPSQNTSTVMSTLPTSLYKIDHSLIISIPEPPSVHSSPKSTSSHNKSSFQRPQMARKSTGPLPKPKKDPVAYLEKLKRKYKIKSCNVLLLDCVKYFGDIRRFGEGNNNTVIKSRKKSSHSATDTTSKSKNKSEQTVEEPKHKNKLSEKPKSNKKSSSKSNSKSTSDGNHVKDIGSGDILSTSEATPKNARASTIDEVTEHIEHRNHPPKKTSEIIPSTDNKEPSPLKPSVPEPSNKENSRLAKDCDVVVTTDDHTQSTKLIIRKRCLPAPRKEEDTPPKKFAIEKQLNSQTQSGNAATNPTVLQNDHSNSSSTSDSQPLITSSIENVSNIVANEKENVDCSEKCDFNEVIKVSRPLTPTKPDGNSHIKKYVNKNSSNKPEMNFITLKDPRKTFLGTLFEANNNVQQSLKVTSFPTDIVPTSEIEVTTFHLETLDLHLTRTFNTQFTPLSSWSDLACFKCESNFVNYSDWQKHYGVSSRCL